MINYEMLPEHCRDGMKLYIEHGIPPGSFLMAVLENNLVEAFGRADDVNINRLYDYASFLYNQAPSGCWGSKEKVSKWMETKWKERNNEISIDI
jgi:hypothetical protein